MKYIRLTEKHLSYEGLENDGIRLSKGLFKPPIFVNHSANKKNVALDIAFFIAWRYLEVVGLLWVVLVILAPASIWLSLYDWGDNFVEPVASLANGVYLFATNRIEEGWSHQEELYGVSTVILSLQLVFFIFLITTLTLSTGSQKIALDNIKPWLSTKRLIGWVILSVICACLYINLDWSYLKDARFLQLTATTHFCVYSAQVWVGFIMNILTLKYFAALQSNNHNNT